MPSDDIARLYDFQPNTTARADQVDQELNQLVNTCNGKAGRGVDNTFTGANTFSGNNTLSGSNTFTGQNTFSNPTAPIKTDKILENTNDTGVTIDGVLIKDGEIPSLMFTGAIMPTVRATAPSGWIFAVGTIGSTSSGASNRANADTQALYTILWEDWDDAEAPVTGGRGASAAADFAANKPIGIPDVRDRVIVGLGNMGGTAANRLTSASTGGANSIKMGGTGGTETHTLTTAQLPNPITNATRFFGVASGIGASCFSVNSATGSGGVENTGGGGAHSNTQPFIALPYLIKL